MESVRAYGALLMRLLSDPLPGGFVSISQHFVASSMLPWGRARVCDLAIKAGATHLLLLDSDMTYPADLAHRLIAHGRPFIATNAVTRRPPVRWVAKDKAGDVIDSNVTRGLTRASVVGMACALVEARVYRGISPPRFNFEWTEKGWRGEDVWFCKRAIQSGFQPMIDNELSLEIGHVGTWVFTGKDVVDEE